MAMQIDPKNNVPAFPFLIIFNKAFKILSFYYSLHSLYDANIVV